MKSFYLPAFTGVRALAAFFVILHHNLNGVFEYEWLNAIARELNIGVNIFFVLSGFLIWYIYSVDLNISKSWLRVYFLKRFARIYPIFFILTTISIILIFFTQNLSVYESLKIYLLNITFLRGFSSIYLYSGIPQGWTLSVEELFYFTLPLLLYLNLKRNINLFILGVGIFLLGIGFYFIFKDLNILGLFNNLKYILISTYFGRVAEFFMGILVAKYFFKFQNLNFKIPVLTLISSFLILLSIVYILPSFQTEHYRYSIQTSFGYLYGVYVFPIFVAVLFIGLLTEKSTFKNFLESNFLGLLGKSSFSLYLIHNGIIASIILKMIGNNTVIFIVIMYVISIGLWKFLEKPFNHAIRKYI